MMDSFWRWIGIQWVIWSFLVVRIASTKCGTASDVLCSPAIFINIRSARFPGSHLEINLLWEVTTASPYAINLEWVWSISLYFKSFLPCLVGRKCAEARNRQSVGPQLVTRWRKCSCHGCQWSRGCGPNPRSPHRMGGFRGSPRRAFNNHREKCMRWFDRECANTAESVTLFSRSWASCCYNF